MVADLLLNKFLLADAMGVTLELCPIINIEDHKGEHERHCDSEVVKLECVVVVHCHCLLYQYVPAI